MKRLRPRRALPATAAVACIGALGLLGAGPVEPSEAKSTLEDILGDLLPRPPEDKPLKDGGDGEKKVHEEKDDGKSVDAPQHGKSVNARPERGKVRVRLPGAKGFLYLTEMASIPIGTLVDARGGAVRLTAARDAAGHVDWATFGEGMFSVGQQRRRPVTEISLRGGSFRRCAARRASIAFASRLPVATPASASRRSVRKLWARGKGRFRTRGRDGAATVRGTAWTTVDRCDGTLVTVRHGRVDVRDFPRRRTVSVAAGGRYLARH